MGGPAPVRHRRARGEGMLLIHIDDDGPGIPEDERERIFERGTRLDEQRPGSGLGLDIARDLARSAITATCSPGSRRWAGCA